ncbi:MAG TPA: hypothetical protein VFF59_06970 [Anaerolineae bacterium]|nr:hypothetical protein [Anaerolineae bacterium]
MATTQLSEPTNKWSMTSVIAFSGALLMVMLAGLGLIATVLGFSPADLINGVLDRALATSSVQVMWYITRAAGLTAYLLVWLSTVWGLAVSNKILDPVLHRAFTYDFHQFVSLLAIGFVIVHIVVLLADQYLPFTVAQILIPFTASYRPVWVGVGVIALYLTLLVSITFYIRRWIGQKTFRFIHLASYLAFAGTALHGLLSGTDSPLWTVQAMYLGTTLVVVFLTAYRVFMSAQAKRQRAALSGRA